MFKLYLPSLAIIVISISCTSSEADAPDSAKAIPHDLMQLYQKGVQLVKRSPDSALLYFREVEAQSRDLHVDYGIGLALSGMGNLATANGNMEQAMAYYESALPYYQKVRDSAALPTLYTNMGAGYNLLGRYPEARRTYQLALDYFLSQAPQDKTLGLVYGNLSDLYINLGDDAKGLYYAEQADNFFRDNAISPPTFTKGLILINKGDAYMNLNRYQEAYTVLQECNNLAQKEHASELTPVVLSTLGELMLRQNENVEAVSYLEKALKQPIQ